MKKLGFTILLFVVILGGFLLWNHPDEQTPSVKQENMSEKTEPHITPPVQAETPNPVSLLALMQKGFDGRELKLGNVLDNNSVYTRYYITYKSGELTISGILNVPKGEVPAGGFPVLVLNHGHIDTSIYTNGRGLKREQDFFARQGFAVLHPDYRNHAQSDKDESNETNIRIGYIEDVINAVYAIKNSGLDYLSKDKIGMLGHSMGGGITQSLLVVKPDLVKAAVLYAPVSMDARDSYERWTKTRPEVVKEIVATHGSPEENPEFWDNISAVTFLHNIKTPTKYYHGTNDKDVPIAWSLKTVGLLKEAGKTTELITYQGQPHEFTPPTWNRFMESSAEFFKQYLK